MSGTVETPSPSADGAPTDGVAALRTQLEPLAITSNHPAEVELNFAADHVAPALPEVMEAVVQWNLGGRGTQLSYSADVATIELVARLSAFFETEVEVLLVPTGTASNSVALATLIPPFGSVYCAVGAHIDTSECGCPEMYSGGKLVKVPTRADGRIIVDSLIPLLRKPYKFPHTSKACAVSVTQPTEAGFCYSLEEVRTICSEAHANGYAVHMDGARFANALESPTLASADGTGPSPADLTWKAGVDVLSLGSTKGGTICAEAVVLFPTQSTHGQYTGAAAVEAAGYLRKRGGACVEKSRFLAAQMLGYLGVPQDPAAAASTPPPWQRAARNANALARYLAARLEKDCSGLGVAVVQPVHINMVFVEMLKSTFDALVSAGYVLSLTAGSADAKGPPSTPDHLRLRLCTFWSMVAADVDALVETIVASAK